MEIKYKRAHIECECTECKKTFMKAKSEITRNKFRERKNFCSISCAMSYSNKLNPRPNQFKIGNTIGKDNGRKKDEFSPFRELLRRARTRSKESLKKILNLTLEDLKEQWDLQKGICIYSGVKLLPPNTDSRGNYNYIASLDRIDSDLGYVKGNIQFTSASINYMKGNLTHDQTLELCRLIADYHK